MSLATRRGGGFRFWDRLLLVQKAPGTFFTIISPTPTGQLPRGLVDCQAVTGRDYSHDR
jgi:hypothetical protein